MWVMVRTWHLMLFCALNGNRLWQPTCEYAVTANRKACNPLRTLPGSWTRRGKSHLDWIKRWVCAYLIAFALFGWAALSRHAANNMSKLARSYCTSIHACTNGLRLSCDSEMLSSLVTLKKIKRCIQVMYFRFTGEHIWDYFRVASEFVSFVAGTVICDNSSSAGVT